MMQIDEHFIQIFGCGQGYGESIILNVSNKILIGIDSMDVALSRSGFGEKPESFLEKLLLEESFICKIWLISHYHYDHFRSCHTLVEHYLGSLDNIFLPLEYSVSDISEMVQNHVIKMTKKNHLPFKQKTNIKN